MQHLTPKSFLAPTVAFVGGLLAGLALGILGILPMNREGMNYSLEQLNNGVDKLASDCTVALAECARNSQVINDAVRRIEEHFTASAVHREEVDPPAMIDGGEPESKGPEMLAGSENFQFAWVQVLPSSIAQALVSRGLSPFDDPSIAFHVREAVNGRKEADAAYGLEYARLSELYKLGQYSNAEWAHTEEQLRAVLNAKQSEALSKLNAVLDAILEAKIKSVGERPK